MIKLQSIIEFSLQVSEKLSITQGIGVWRLGSSGCRKLSPCPGSRTVSGSVYCVPQGQGRTKDSKAFLTISCRSGARSHEWLWKQVEVWNPSSPWVASQPARLLYNAPDRLERPNVRRQAHVDATSHVYVPLTCGLAVKKCPNWLHSFLHQPLNMLRLVIQRRFES